MQPPSAAIVAPIMDRRRMSKLLPLFASVLGLVSQTAHASDVRFTGESRATPQLKTDVLVAITGYSRHQYKCPEVSSIESALLPATYKPRTPLYQIAAPNHHYERWVATVCDGKRTFLVGLWPVPQGGADFKVVEIPPGVEP
jgi:hypothetical protein